MELVSLHDEHGVLLAEFQVSPDTPRPRATSMSFVGGSSEPIAAAIVRRLAGHRVGVFDRGDVATQLQLHGGGTSSAFVADGARPLYLTPTGGDPC